MYSMYIGEVGNAISILLMMEFNFILVDCLIQERKQNVCLTFSQNLRENNLFIYYHVIYFMHAHIHPSTHSILLTIVIKDVLCAR